MKRILTLFVLMVFLGAAVNCASWNKTTRGAVIGGAGGAVIGGVIGRAAGNTLLGAILGAAVGGAAGAYIGNYMDKQAAEMQRDLEGAEIQRIGEGIKITFDSGILFDIDKSDLRPVSRRALTAREAARRGIRLRGRRPPRAGASASPPASPPVLRAR